MSSLPVGAIAPEPRFSDLGLPKTLTEVLDRLGITQPLPIQAATISDALAGRDVCGMAPTGSGKTLAFALPMAAMVRRGAPKRPQALVLAPTRELAAQIAGVLAPLLKVQGRRVASFYGGVGFGPQRKALRQGIDVAVACPGRLEDLMGTGDIDLSDVQMVVVDEADRMADMGFLPCVRRILNAARPDRQTLLFSATLDGDVKVLVREYQREPVRHEVAPPTGGAQVSHSFQSVERENRVSTCVDLVAGRESTIVFVKTKRAADRLAAQLSRSGVKAAAIHGDRSQAQRDRALAAFRANSVQVLVATDVAARGIHVDDVACVIHFDVAADAKDYVHRSGRTGRAGAQGAVITLVTPDQQLAATSLRRQLGIDTGARSPRPSKRPEPGRSRPLKQVRQHRAPNNKTPHGRNHRRG